METPYFNRKALVECRDLLSAFRAQLEEDADIRRHQRDKYDILVPVIDVERLPENLRAQIKAREKARNRDGPAAVGKVVTLMDALVADYDNFNETFKDVSTKRRPR